MIAGLLNPPVAFRRIGVLVPCLVRRFATQTAIPPELLESTRRPFKPSPEQKTIVNAARIQNVMVSARPGSGKTATAEAIVAANTSRRVVILTYSKRLQLETARRLEDYNACDVYTFHGVAGRIYDTVVRDDASLRSLRREGSVPIWSGPPYDIVILDEMQDCTDDIFWLVCSFISSITHAAGGQAPKIVALGDERQAIYAFRGADSRYLSLIPETMAGMSPYPWTSLTLSKSFRLSEANARFVNDVWLGGDKYVIGTHHGPKPSYFHATLHNVQRLARELVPLILQYGAEQTAILAPFVRSNKALSRLTNHLSKKYGISIAVSVADDVPLDDLVIGGKLCVSTYHQFKGNERDFVIVYGADAGYFEFLARNLPDDRCPNETFVALTRAKKKMVVLHNDENEPMPFMSLNELPRRAKYRNFSSDPMKAPSPVGRPLQLDLLLPIGCGVADMSRHVPEEALEDIIKAELHINIANPPLPPGQCIDAPDITLTDPAKMHYEAISDINGLAVVAAFEHSQTGQVSTLNCSPVALLSAAASDAQKAVWYCREACRYDAEVSGYESRRIQMAGHAFDWLGPYLAAATQRLAGQLATTKKTHNNNTKEKLEFEVKLKEDKFRVKENTRDEYQEVHLRGRADIVQHHHNGNGVGGEKATTVWEIKFVAKLTLQHAVQAAAYAYLWARKTGAKTLPRVVLFNVRDGEKWEITAPRGVAGSRKVVEEVLRAKYTQKGEEPTEVFLQKCAKTREEVERMWKM